MTGQSTATPHTYPCDGCGARVEYVPGADALRCPYCGHQRQLAAPEREVREHSYAELVALPRKPVASIAPYLYVCERCGAQTQSDTLSDRCQFCTAPMVAQVSPGEQIVPEAVLPFVVDQAGVRTALRKWVSSRWFAPSQLKKVSEAESMTGMYLPHWTFDAQTVTHYRGQRGEYYYETVTTTRMVDGKPQTQTTQVRHTRWYSVQGRVARHFDDVLVPATGRVANERLDKLGPWPLLEAVPYRPDYLAGYQTLRYDTEPETGLEVAKQRMAEVIYADCRRDIGGDEQRVLSVNTSYSAIMFKLMLLPIWIASYVYGGKTWQVLVNGRTGAVVGERPYSIPKIIAAVVAGLLLVAALLAIIMVTGET